MRADFYSKPTTDAYGAMAIASLVPAPLLAQVNVTPPTVDADPNVAGLLPTSVRVLAYPQVGHRPLVSMAATILGGTSLVGRFWFYDTASGKWLTFGNLVTLTVAVGGGTISAAGARTKALYFQVTTINGAVTDLSYGFIS